MTTRAWTERGRSRKRSTYTADSTTAQAILAKKINKRRERPGPSDPSEIVVTDVLSHYATKRAPEVEAPRVIGCAIDALTGFWQARAVVDVTPETCSAYGEWRSRSQNTGRLSTVLQAAINYAHKCGRITRSVIVTLLAKPQSKERWLTNHEAALLLRALLRSPLVRTYLPLFILLSIYTGRRKEAVLNLRWPRVDLNRGVIDFRDAAESKYLASYSVISSVLAAVVAI